MNEPTLNVGIVAGERFWNCWICGTEDYQRPARRIAERAE